MKWHIAYPRSFTRGGNSNAPTHCFIQEAEVRMKEGGKWAPRRAISNRFTIRFEEELRIIVNAHNSALAATPTTENTKGE